MERDRTSLAVERIDAALARIEAAARRPRGGGSAAELATLRARHERLCAAVQDGLDQLDELIETVHG